MAASWAGGGIVSTVTATRGAGQAALFTAALARAPKAAQAGVEAGDAHLEGRHHVCQSGSAGVVEVGSELHRLGDRRHHRLEPFGDVGGDRQGLDAGGAHLGRGGLQAGHGAPGEDDRAALLSKGPGDALADAAAAAGDDGDFAGDVE